MGAFGSTANEPAARAFIEKTINAHPVTIFSKSYCPYCDMAKDVMRRAGVPYHVVELDDMRGELSGGDVQSVLGSMTGRRTVPNVFLNKESIGGGTDVQALFHSGELTQMLKDAGVLH